MELLQVLKLRLQQVSGHSGLCGYLQVFFRASDVRAGALVGKHKYGNKCYEDNKQFFGRHRWVIYTTEMNGKNTFWGTSLVAQWLRMCLPMQGTWLQALVWEDPTCRGATKPLRHNY